jgi:hypothetical protein
VLVREAVIVLWLQAECCYHAGPSWIAKRLNTNRAFRPPGGSLFGRSGVTGVRRGIQATRHEPGRRLGRVPDGSPEGL